MRALPGACLHYPGFPCAASISVSTELVVGYMMISLMEIRKLLPNWLLWPTQGADKAASGPGYVTFLSARGPGLEASNLTLRCTLPEVKPTDELSPREPYVTVSTAAQLFEALAAISYHNLSTRAIHLANNIHLTPEEWGDYGQPGAQPLNMTKGVRLFGRLPQEGQRRVLLDWGQMQKVVRVQGGR